MKNGNGRVRKMSSFSLRKTDDIFLMLLQKSLVRKVGAVFGWANRGSAFLDCTESIHNSASSQISDHFDVFYCLTDAIGRFCVQLIHTYS